MKLLNKIMSISATALLLVGCTDGFEDINSDNNKIYTPTFQSIFPGTVYKTMNLFSQLNYYRMWSYSRYVTVQAFQGGMRDGNDGYYRTFYVDILRDLRAMEKEYANSSNKNSYAAILTWKVLLYYNMTSLYGPVMMSDAGYESVEKKQVKYDDEADAYKQILDLLTTAYDTFDEANGGNIVKDPIYEGDVEKWKKLANTLRLEVAMNVQNISEEEAREYASKSLEHQDDIFASADDQLMPKFGTVETADGSFYYKQIWKPLNENGGRYDNVPSFNEYSATYLFSFNDPRYKVWFLKSGESVPNTAKHLIPDVLTRAHDCDVSNCNVEKRAQHLNWMLEGKEVRDSLLVEYWIPYVPTADGPGSRLPFGWQANYDPADPSGNYRVKDPLPGNIDARCYINPKYYAMDIAIPMLRYSDACFLQAEAKVKFGLGSKSAETLYKNGIAASFEENGLTTEQLTAYMAQDGIKWGTSHIGFDDSRRLYTAKIDGANGDEGKLDQIYKQRYFAGWLDGLGAWRLERRTRNLNFPPFFDNGNNAYEEGGNRYYCWPERIDIPLSENETNKTNYLAALANMQAKSKEPNSGRWGDNIFTLLQFAKPVPNKEATIHHYENDILYVDFNMDMQAKYYGKTWEDFVKTARQQVEPIEDESEADLLKRAFNLNIRLAGSIYTVDQ